MLSVLQRPGHLSQTSRENSVYCNLSLDEKPVIFCSAKNFRYFFCFRWYGRKRKWHNNFSFILPAEKKTRFAMQKIYFLWYFNYFLTNEAKKYLKKSKKIRPHLRPKTCYFRPLLIPNTKNNSTFGRSCGRKVKTSCRPSLL